MRIRLIPLLLLALVGLTPAGARADFYLVVNTANPQRALTTKEAVDLYMGRRKSFTNGDFALVFDLPRDSPRRNAFYLALTGMGPAEVNSYWSRLMFSGQSTPPQPLPDEAGMIEIVSRNPSALGWLSREPADKQLRVLLVLKEAP